jgi:tetrahydromethanopterin S-methyltransferase subunit G
MLKVLRIFLLILLINPVISVMAQDQVIVPFTLADRDRMVRLEERLDKLEVKMDARFDGVQIQFVSIQKQFDNVQKQFENIQKQFDNIQKQFDQLYTLFYWGFGIIIMLVIFNMGYTMWDRRTVLTPAIDKADTADIKSTNLIRALRDYLKDHPDLANFLKIHGLL